MARAGGVVKLGGVGGSGLLRFVPFFCEESCSTLAFVAEKSSKETVCGVRSFTSFPWRCRGAGGGFFFSFRTSPPIRLLCSSSESAISYDVRGDSGWESCVASKIDCRDMEEVSVLLLSKVARGRLDGFEAGADCRGGPELRGLAIPCINRFLKPSTFRDCRLPPDIDLSVAIRSADHLVSTRIQGIIIGKWYCMHDPLESDGGKLFQTGIVVGKCRAANLLIAPLLR